MKGKFLLSATAAGALAIFVANAVHTALFSVPTLGANAQWISAIAGIACAAGLAFVAQTWVFAAWMRALATIKDLVRSNIDFSRTLPEEGDRDINELAHGVNAFIRTAQDLIKPLQKTAATLTRTAEELVEGSRRASHHTLTQRQEIASVASAVSQMSGTVQEVANNVATAAADAGNADQEANAGKQVVAETMQAIRALASDIRRAAQVISQLQRESENIGSVLDVIRGIAEQTNLLALNAAIEAARAGEQGRGFAVVADEVRTLASRTQTSTEEIHAMIERLQHGALDAVTVMEEGRKQAEQSVSQAERAGASLTEITRAVSVIKHVTNQIAVASREQSQVTAEINRSIANIAKLAGATAEGSEQNLSNCQTVMTLAHGVEAAAAKFRA